MTPDTLAKANNEHSHQRALFAWANMAARFGFKAAWDDRCYTEKGYAVAQYSPPAAVSALDRMFAIPNGGARDKITAGKLKAEGVKPGVLDIFLPLPFSDRRYCGLFIEMKRPQTTKVGTRKSKIVEQAAGSTSDEQDDWIAYLRSIGYGVSVCFDWQAAAREVQSYVETSNQSAT